MHTTIAINNKWYEFFQITFCLNREQVKEEKICKWKGPIFISKLWISNFEGNKKKKYCNQIYYIGVPVDEMMLGQTLADSFYYSFHY